MKKIKKFALDLLKSTLFMIACAFLAVFLLVLAYLIPVDRERVELSIETVKAEGWYPNVLNLVPHEEELFFSNEPGILDGGGTDAVVIMDYSSRDFSGPQIVKSVLRMSSYYYYWHGYAVILRPLFYVFGILEIRHINHIVQTLLVMFAVYLAFKKKGLKYAFLFLTSYFLLMPQALAMSLQYSPVFYISVISTLFVFLKYDRYRERIFFIFLVSGMLTSFFDLLTYPLLTWGMPALWLILIKEEGTVKENVVTVIKTGFTWIYGYAGFWVLKWLISWPFLGKKVIQKAIAEVLFRSGTDSDYINHLNSRLEAVFVNWKHYSYKIYFLMIILWTIVLFTVFIKRGMSKAGHKAASLALLSLSPVAWCFVVSNHTIEHHLFSHRVFSLMFIAIFAAIMDMTDYETERKGIKIKGCLIAVIGIIIGAAASLIYMKSSLYVPYESKLIAIFMALTFFLYAVVAACLIIKGAGAEAHTVKPDNEE